MGRAHPNENLRPACIPFMLGNAPMGSSNPILYFEWIKKSLFSRCRRDEAPPFHRPCLDARHAGVRAAAARKTDNKSGHTLKLPLKAAISPPFVVFTAKKQAASVRLPRLTEKPPPPYSCTPKRIRFARPHFSPPRQSLPEKHSRQLQCFFRRRCRAKPPASSRVNLPKVQRVSLPAANALRETRSPRVIAKAA